MKNLNNIAEELFNKLRGRFPKITIGDADSTITNDPKEARFFDFELSNGEKVNVSLDEESVTVMYNNKLFDEGSELDKGAWYDFLKELRQFSKKRMLNFDTRDITKSNLDKRDYEYLAKERGGETTMSESKMYGTSRTSFQNIGNARMVIKHSEPVNQELASGRSQKIHSIYIESESGERFKYPFKHLNGARAVARHVSEGGNLYDDIGQHIVSLSEELSKLRKFKTYMNRSTVMAEGLSGYMDVVYDRIATVKKTVESLQKESSYKEFVENFEPKESVEVPEDVQSDWIDQLTIRQFNEELKGVFPYIYKLVSEASAVQELGPEELVDESGLQRYTGIKKYGKKGFEELQKAGREGASEEEKGAIKDKYLKKKNKTDEELEAAYEAMMGQFAEEEVCEECGNPSWTTLGMTEEEIEEGERHGNSKIYDKCWKGYRKVPGKKAGEKGSCKKVESEGDIEENELPKSKKVLKLVIDDLKKFKAEKEEAKKQGYDEDVRMMQSRIDDMMDIANLIKDGGPIAALDTSVQDVIVDYYEKAGEPLPFAKEGNAYGDTIQKAKKAGKKKGDKIQGPDGDEITLEKEQKTPLGEFILSYFDYTTGQFPKGETAVLTMVEKDYGEEYITPAKQFIEQINNKVAEVMGYREEAEVEEGRPITGGLKVVEKILQGITKDFVNGDDSAAQEMVDMLKKYNAPMDKVADMLEQKAKELTKKTFSIFDNPLKKTPEGDAADRMILLADYIRKNASKSEELERIRGLAGL